MQAHCSGAATSRVTHARRSGHACWKYPTKQVAYSKRANGGRLGDPLNPGPGPGNVDPVGGNAAMAEGKRGRQRDAKDVEYRIEQIYFSQNSWVVVHERFPFADECIHVALR
jgi:hypothetical protein